MAANRVVHRNIYWHGRHPQLGWGSPLGKLHRGGLAHLHEHGWRQVSFNAETDAADCATLPAMSWATRRAGLDFAADEVIAPIVRQLPQTCTDVLDDKRRCALLLGAAYQQLESKNDEAGRDAPDKLTKLLKR